MIPALHRANTGFLLRHPWQLALAIIGICIGVAAIIAVDLANSSARKAFFLSLDAVTGKATHQIIGGPRGVSEDLYARLRVELGLRSVAPVVEGSVEVAGQGLQLLGVDLFAEEELRDLSRRIEVGPAAGGSGAESLFRGLLTRPGAAIVSEATANLLGLRTGQRFELVAGGRTHQGFVLGTFNEGDSEGLDDLVLTDIATAQKWLNSTGLLTRIDVRLDDEDGMRAEDLERFLPVSVKLLSAAGRTRSTLEMSAAFMTNLTAMSLLALLVGLFLIYNSASFSVLQRRHLVGVLRALGVTRRQVFALILGEAAMIGLAASMLGIALGTWLGQNLLSLVTQSINDFYFRLSVTDVSVGIPSLARGMAAGIGATLVAAAVPAFEAASYRPRLAMTRSALEIQTRRALPGLAAVGTCLILLGIALLLLSGRSLVAGLTSVFLLILGFALCVPIAVSAATALLARLAKWFGGTPARVAVAGIRSGLSRTGVAIVALAVAVSATIGVSVMVESFRGSVNAWLEQTLQADIYFGVKDGSLDPGLLQDLVSLPGIQAHSTSRRAWLENDNGRTRVLAIRMAPGSYAGTEILDADPDDIWPVFEQEDAVLVSEPYAYQNRVIRGDTISLRTDAGTKAFRVAAVYQSYDINASAVLMSRRTYDRHWDDTGVDSVGLYLDERARAQDVLAQLRSLSRGRQEIRARSNVEIRDLSLQIFDRTFIITDILYWLALGVAVIGILGAMLALQLERARELALLRALGMTPVQLGGMITLQTGVMGMLSGLAAIPLGVLMAWMLVAVVNRRAFGWQIELSIAPAVLTWSVLFAILAALLAGIYPAIRAAASEPALAMREE